MSLLFMHKDNKVGCIVKLKVKGTLMLLLFPATEFCRNLFTPLNNLQEVMKPLKIPIWYNHEFKIYRLCIKGIQK